MKTYFYNRTAYSLDLPTITVPKCFLKLEQYFDDLSITSPGLTHKSVKLAENLCRRIADVELYAWYISDALKSTNKGRASILIGSLLVGYFNACKSLLDAGAITLAEIYHLKLTNKEMDFSKSKFWKVLEKQIGSVIKDRYAPFLGLFNDIIVWRDAATHRVTPLVVRHSNGPPDTVPHKKVAIMMAAQPEPEMTIVVANPMSIRWVEPLYYHKKWESQLIQYCAQICLDIRSQTH
jgi:hypothetical protein